MKSKNALSTLYQLDAADVPVCVTDHSKASGVIVIMNTTVIFGI